jgi:cytochrome c oxidase assembly factor CtaG
MSIDLWSGAFTVLLTVPVVGSILVATRTGFRGWRWWGLTVFVCGWALGVGAVLSRLDELGENGALSAHIAQHVILSDLAAPLLLLGLAPQLRRPLERGYARLVSSNHPGSRGLVWIISPIGALIVWALMTYFWLIPPVHRLAIPAGGVQFLDHLSFLIFGLLVWLGAFDFRKGRRVSDWESLKTALVTCDLAWWARHIYSMICRLAMLPAVIAIWLASSSAYFLPGQYPPGGRTRYEEQVQAASLMLGFEMLLFCLAVVLAFIFVAVAEGRARDGA